MKHIAYMCKSKKGSIKTNYKFDHHSYCRDMQLVKNIKFLSWKESLVDDLIFSYTLYTLRQKGEEDKVYFNMIATTVTRFSTLRHQAIASREKHSIV